MTHNRRNEDDPVNAIVAALAVGVFRQWLAAARLGPTMPEETGLIVEDWRTLPRLSVQTTGGAS